MFRLYLRLLALVGVIFGATEASAYSFPVYVPVPPAQTVQEALNATGAYLNDNVDIASSGISTDEDFTYRYSTKRTSTNLRNFIARTAGPAARANLEQMFAAQPKLMEDIRAGIRPYGLDSHNVADAYVLWMVNAWLIANKRDEDPDVGTIAMVKQQVRAAFAATPDFAKASDADRQEYAEALLVQAVMLEAAFEQMKGDPAQLEQVANAARQGAKASGLDLSKITLTPNGFVRRKGADASGAVEDEDDTARNARADTPAADGESSPLGLALAAGAGLGVTLLGGLALMRRG